MAIYSEFSINSMVIFHSFLYVYQRVPKKLRSPLFFRFFIPGGHDQSMPRHQQTAVRPKGHAAGEVQLRVATATWGMEKTWRGFTGKHIASTCHFLWREFTRQFICRNKKAVKTSWFHQQPWGVATTVKILIWQNQAKFMDFDFIQVGWFTPVG